MRRHQSLFRLSAAMAIGGLVCGPGFAPLARAQTAEPATAPAPAPAATETAAPVDPPARVGRLAAVTGTVSFHTADQTEWQVASINYPVTSGNAFWTEPKANAALGLGDVKLVLDQQTEADIDTLDDTTLAATEPQGAIYLHVRALPPGVTTTVTTPRGVVTVTAAGRYEIVAGDAEQPTRVVVIDGGATIVVGDVTLAVAPHQAASVTGSDAASFQGSVGVAVEDPFITAELAKEQPAPVAQTTVATATVAYTPPPLVQQMTGYESLQTVGQWQPSPQYGHVWYPPVAATWVPYRDGHWAYVAPWGWTWVDNAPWGFAPFHYGRWARFGPRWGWVPYNPGLQVDVAVARPVYAPALVSFIGIGAAIGGGVGVGLGVGIGVGGFALGASIGWVPLAPSEPYYPPFRASPIYLRNVNITHVSNVTNITNVTNNNVTINHYANAQAATVVPAQTMTNSAPVARAVQPVTPQQLAAARPAPVGQAPVTPTAATAGVTPTVARQFNIAQPAVARTPAAGGVTTAPGALHRPAPGPAIAAVPAAAAAVGGRPAVAGKPAAAEAPARPPLAPAGSEPANAAKPATPAVAPKPGTPAPAVKPAELGKPATPAEANKPAEVGKPAELGKPAAPAEANKQAEVAKPAEASKPVEAAKPAETPKPAESGKAPTAAAKPALPALVKPNPSPKAPSSEARAPQTHAAPAAKPEQKPAEKPAPAQHAAPPANHPAPQAHPAPKPAARPAPKEEPKKCPGGKESC